MAQQTIRRSLQPSQRRGRWPAAAPWLALSALSMAVGSAFAQGAPAPAGAASAPAADTKAESAQRAQQVTISATRRRELIREVPLAITSVPVERLQETGAKTFNDYIAAVPGVVVQNSGVTDGTGMIVIRGLTLGTDSNSPTTVYLDDVPLARGSTFDLNLLDLKRFEVLKGPQGTLYGSSAMGGIVKYSSVEPDTSAFSARLNLGLGRTQHGGTNSLLGATLNVPVQQDVAAVRVIAFGTRDAGWVNATGPAGRDGVDKRDSHGGRVTLLVTPTRELSVTLGAMTQTRNAEGTQRLVYDRVTNEPVAGDLVYPGLGQAEPSSSKRDLYSLTVDYDLKWARFTSVTSHQKLAEQTTNDFYSYLPVLGIPASSAYADSTIDHAKTTQEFRLVSQGDGPMQWLVGAFFDKFTFETTSAAYLVFPTGPTPFSSDGGKREYRESALYGNVTFDVTPDLSVTGGLRLAKYKQTDDARTSVSPNNLVNFDEKVTTYLLAAKYRLDAQSNVYARAASGYRPGGANFSSLDPSTGQPVPGARLSYGTDSVWTYELGYKAQLSDGAAVEVAVFDAEWKDLQQFTQPGGVGAVGFTSNLGKARVTGIEAAGSFRLTRDFSVGAALALMNPKLLTDSPGLQAMAGDRLPNSPKTALGVNARYNFALAGSPAFAGVNVNHVGSRHSSFPGSASNPDHVLPAYTQIDVAGGVKLGSFDVGVYVRNLTNTRGQLGAATAEVPITGRLYVHVIDPRTVGINLSTTF